MKLSRRGFIGKSLKALAMAAIAPILPVAVTKSITANPVPKDKGEIIGFRKHVDFKCNDFAPNVTVIDYKRGQTIPDIDFSETETSCIECVYHAKCAQNGQQFQNSLELWN